MALPSKISQIYIKSDSSTTLSGPIPIVVDFENNAESKEQVEKIVEEKMSDIIISNESIDSLFT